MDDYADLEIIIQEPAAVESAAQTHAYPVLAFYPGQPRASSVLRLDPMRPQWMKWQERLTEVVRDVGADFLHEVGWALYQKLFTGEVERLWTIAQADLDSGRVPGVRVRLAIDPPAIAALPWELLYDERIGRSIACRSRHPLVRAVGRVGQVPPRRPISIRLPLRVLFIAPEDTGLNWERELQIVRGALKQLGDRAELRTLTGQATFAAFSELLGGWQPHVLHFATHGEFDGTYGQLMFTASPEDRFTEDGLTWVRSDQMRTLLNARGESVRLVVLATCKGAQTSSRPLSEGRLLAGLGPALIQAGVPAVIGMQYEIRDDVAIAFAHALYRSLLGSRHPGRVDAAVADARAELEARWPDHQGYATPVLFLNAEHGRIFTLVGEEGQAAVQVEERPRELPEAEREYLRRQPLRDLRNRMRALADRVAQRQRHLDALQEQMAVYTPAERPLHLQEQIHVLGDELADDEAELAAVRALVTALDDAGAPEEVSPEDFEAGVLTEAVLEEAVAQQPYERAFYAADLARWLQTTYPEYWDRVVRRSGGQSEAERTIYRRLVAMARPGGVSSRRHWFLVQRETRFKRVHY